MSALLHCVKSVFKSAFGIALVLLLLEVPLVAWGALDLELTQGLDAAVPIAVLPFVGEGDLKLPGHTCFSDIIRHDLEHSGQFRVVESDVKASSPATPDGLNFSTWRKAGANYVLIGQVERRRFRKIDRIRFELVSLFDQGHQAARGGKVLLIHAVEATPEGLRAAAHRISDRVYEQITGIPGIFSTKIAYVLVQQKKGNKKNYSLELADADGFDPKTLLSSSHPLMSPAFSPDGRELAYVSFERQRAGVYVQDIASGKRRLVSQYDGLNGAPAFSPDGRRLALVLTRTGNPNLYLLDLDDKHLEQLTRGYAIDTEPSWAPDGKSLVFTSGRGGSPQIFRYDFGSKKIERLTFSGNYNARPRYFPNGNDLVMMHRDVGAFNIARLNIDTGRLEVLTDGNFDESPSVAPNGQMVLYATHLGDRGVLGMVSMDGRVRLRLPAREGDVRDPAWSPYLK